VPVSPRPARPADAWALTGAMGADGDRYEARLVRGCRCFAAWLDGRVAGYGWLSTGAEWIGELEREIVLPPGEAYAWNCVTLPASRRRGVFRALLGCIAESARRDGARRLWIGSAGGLGGPPAGTGAIGEAGFVPALRAELLALPGLRVVVARTVPAAGREPSGTAWRALRLPGRAPGSGARPVLLLQRRRARWH
jgi:GNAT superfamily N-acetyltransferase